MPNEEFLRAQEEELSNVSPEKKTGKTQESAWGDNTSCILENQDTWFPNRLTQKLNVLQSFGLGSNAGGRELDLAGKEGGTREAVNWPGREKLLVICIS